MLVAVVTLTVLSADLGESAESMCTQLHRAVTGQMNTADAKRFGGTLQFRLDDFRERMINATGSRVTKPFSKADSKMLTKTLTSDGPDPIPWTGWLAIFTSFS